VAATGTYSSNVENGTRTMNASNMETQLTGLCCFSRDARRIGALVIHRSKDARK
jgi:hypothetical protein